MSNPFGEGRSGPGLSAALGRVSPLRGIRPSLSRGYGLVRAGDRREVADGGEALERLALELAHTLAREAELVPDGLERPRIALEAEAQLEDAPFAFRKRVERLAHALLAQRLLRLVERVDRLAVREEIAELAFVVGADRLVQRDGRRRSAERLVDMLNREAGSLGELLLRGIAPQLDLQAARRAAELLLALDDMHGHANRARVVGDGALHGLADPPSRVGGELEAAAPVELLDGAVEPECALLDEVQERHAEAAIALRDRDDEAQVALDHLALGDEIALLDPLCERDLLGGGQKPVATDVREEELQAVPRAVHGLGRDLELLWNFLDGRAELESERLELSGLDVTALFGAFDQGPALERVK